MTTIIQITKEPLHAALPEIHLHTTEEAVTLEVQAAEAITEVLPEEVTVVADTAE